MTIATVSSESKFDNSSNDDDMRDMNNLAVVLGFILDGDLEIGAHVWSDIGYLICSRHLTIPRTVINLGFFRKDLHTCATCSLLPSNINTMINFPLNI